MDYEEFLKTKIDIAKDSGFEVAKDEINKAKDELDKPVDPSKN